MCLYVYSCVLKVGLDPENDCALYSLILNDANGFFVMLKLLWEVYKALPNYVQVARTKNHYRKSQ